MRGEAVEEGPELKCRGGRDICCINGVYSLGRFVRMKSRWRERSWLEREGGIEKGKTAGCGLVERKGERWGGRE
jgi:hypothetical protein